MPVEQCCYSTVDLSQSPLLAISEHPDDCPPNDSVSGPESLGAIHRWWLARFGSPRGKVANAAPVLETALKTALPSALLSTQTASRGPTIEARAIVGPKSLTANSLCLGEWAETARAARSLQPGLQSEHERHETQEHRLAKDESVVGETRGSRTRASRYRPRAR